MGGEGGAVSWLLPSRYSLLGGRHELELVCERDSPWGLVLGARRSSVDAHQPGTLVLSRLLCDMGHLGPHGLCGCPPTPLLELGSLQRGPSRSTDSGQTGLRFSPCDPVASALLG